MSEEITKYNKSTLRNWLFFATPALLGITLLLIDSAVPLAFRIVRNSIPQEEKQFEYAIKLLDLREILRANGIALIIIGLLILALKGFLLRTGSKLKGLLNPIKKNASLLVLWIMGTGTILTFLLVPKLYFQTTPFGRLPVPATSTVSKVAVLDWNTIIPILVVIYIVGGLALYTIKRANQQTEQHLPKT